MPPELKIYKINDFIRMNKSGEMDIDQSIQTVRQLASASSFHPAHNILIDLRETTALYAGMDDLFKICSEFTKLMPSFENKIASVVPDDLNRVATAKQFEACMTIKKYQYKFFTDFENAINWLSDVNE
jgi:hypothetical protein